MVKYFKCNQFGYTGYYSLVDTRTNRLLHGGGLPPCQRPRIYETQEAAQEAAQAIKWTTAEPVLLIYSSE